MTVYMGVICIYVIYIYIIYIYVIQHLPDKALLSIGESAVKTSLYGQYYNPASTYKTIHHSHTPALPKSCTYVYQNPASHIGLMTVKTDSGIVNKNDCEIAQR